MPCKAPTPSGLIKLYVDRSDKPGHFLFELVGVHASSWQLRRIMNLTKGCAKVAPPLADVVLPKHRRSMTGHPKPVYTDFGILFLADATVAANVSAA